MPECPHATIIFFPIVLRFMKPNSPPLPRRRSRLDEAAWYLDSDDSSSLGSPSTPPMLNGEWPCLPPSRLLLHSCGYYGENHKKLTAGQAVLRTHI